MVSKNLQVCSFKHKVVKKYTKTLFFFSKKYQFYTGAFPPIQWSCFFFTPGVNERRIENNESRASACDYNGATLLSFSLRRWPIYLVLIILFRNINYILLYLIQPVYSLTYIGLMVPRHNEIRESFWKWNIFITFSRGDSHSLFISFCVSFLYLCFNIRFDSFPI